MDGVTSIIVVAPAFAHADIAKKCAPWLKTDQKILLHPATMFGALEFSNVLKENGNSENVVIGETISLLYAARLIEAGRVNVLGVKKVLPVSVFPSSRLDEFMEEFIGAIPQMTDHYHNVFETGLQNLGIVFHPLPTIMSTSMIESDRDWLYYYDGITESVGNAIKDIDKERVAIGRALKMDVFPLEQVMEELYGVTGENISEMISNVNAYAGVHGQHDINTRYLTEEIPYAMIPMISLAKKLGVKTPVMEATVTLAESLLQKDLHENARTLDSVGLADMEIYEILNYLETGSKA